MNLEAEVFKRSELLEKYIVNILFGCNDRKFKDKYLKKLERSWARWKGKRSQVSLKVEPEEGSTVMVCLNLNIFLFFLFIYF